MSGLLNFLQGASNAAASNVSAPVDGLAWLLKKAGVNVGTPVGGSDWMRAKGLTADAPGIGGLLGESVGGVLPMIAAAKAPQIASGLLKVGENAAARPMLNPQTGAIVVASKKSAPRAKDLAIAQKNAAKPISEGGLGLRPDNTPMERAQAMGFDTEVFHGTRTPEPIKEFIPGGAAGSVRSGDAYGVGTYTSTDPLTASSKAYTGEDGAVMPLLLNRKNHLDLEAPSQAQLDRVGSFMADQMLPADKARFPQNIKQAMFSADDVSSAKDFFRNQQANAEQFGGGYERTQPWIDKSTDGRFVIHYTDFDAPVSLKTGGDVETALRGVGYDSVPLMGFDGHTMRRNIGEQWDVTTNPARLRSRFAAFDPFKKDSADLLASIGGMGLLSPFLFDRNKSTD